MMVSMQPLSVAKHLLDNKHHSNSFHGTGSEGLKHDTDLTILEHGGSLEDFHKFKNGYDCTSSQLGSMETVEDLNKVDQKEMETSKLIWSFGKKDTLTKPTPPKPMPRVSSTEKEGNNNIHTVKLHLAPLEPRFGFSVSGGADESFPARIDNISKGKNLAALIHTSFYMSLIVRIPVFGVSDQV